MSSSSLSPLATVRADPPFTEISWIPWRPRSLVVKKRLVESGLQVKLLTQRSSDSVRFARRPIDRSSTIRRHRSLSYPARVCERQARYLPSGEYFGLTSAPGEVEILRASPPAMEITYR